jgi:predicted esterase
MEIKIMRKYFLLVFLQLIFIYSNVAAHAFNPAQVNVGTDRVNANGEHLVIQTYHSQHHNPHPRLLIFIHGDGSAGDPPADYLKYQAVKFVDANTVAVVLIRPGYCDSNNNYSSGKRNALDSYGHPCDGYSAKMVATLAAAVAELKKYYQPRCTILIGHSGGAIMSGIILGKYPHLVDGAVLASVIYNVMKLSQRHQWGSWTQSLSPNTWINSIPKNTVIDIVSGNRDEITYPDLAYQYYLALKQADVSTNFISVPNGTHNSVVTDQAQYLNDAIKNVLIACNDSM